MQRGQTEIRVNDVRYYQWLTNQIAEAPLHWRHEFTGALKIMDMKMANKTAGYENARHENARQEIAGRENAGHGIARLEIALYVR